MRYRLVSLMMLLVVSPLLGDPPSDPPSGPPSDPPGDPPRDLTSDRTVDLTQIADQMEMLVQPYLDAQVVNAVSIGVVHGDEQWTGHYGTLAADHAVPPADSTIYEIGSISKVFTGIVLADAVIDDRVRLDQPIGDLIPELKANPAVGEAIELVHLSTHMSGLPRMPINMQPADIENPYADYDRSMMISFLQKIKPIRKPGDKYEYSNLAVGLLGQALAIHAGQSYAELLRMKVAGPLGMDQTTVELNVEQQSRLAPPHTADLIATKNWDLNSFVGAGGIRSSTADMLTFIRAHLDPPDGQIGKAIELAWQERLPAQRGAFAMGLGWHIARDGETRWHNGQTGGYHTAMYVDRRNRSGVILMCNTATGSVDALAESIMHLIDGQEVKPQVFPKRIQVDAAVVQRLVGNYRLAPGLIVTMRAEGDQLFAQLTGQAELRVYPKSETRWEYRVVDAELEFVLPESGMATELTLHQNGRQMRSPRVDQD